MVCRNIARHNCPGANESVIPDGDSFENDGASADEHVISDLNRTRVIHVFIAPELIAAERQYLTERIGDVPGLLVYPSATNFLLLKITRPGWDAPRLQQGLIRHGILIRDCRSFPGLGVGFMRIAVRARKDNSRLLSALQQTFDA